MKEKHNTTIDLSRPSTNTSDHLIDADVDHHLLMSTTPQGSTSNQDDFNLTATNPTTISEEEKQAEFIVIDDGSDCPRTEAFELPKSKKFKSSTSLISNGSDPIIMASNGNGNNPVEAMEHTNGGTPYNGVGWIL